MAEDDRLRLGFDTGGTYTDAVLYSPARGIVASAKALTTRHDLSIGISGAALAVLEKAGANPADIGLVSMSTTLATNALVEGQGGRVALIGIGFETIGDLQLSRFRADPANKGKLMDRGLWRYTRHPNYFGDACAWWGIWLVSASLGWEVALAGIIGPLFLTFTLTRWSGKPLLEKGLAKSRPGYAEYVARTSGFLPLPPKRQ